MANIKKNKQNDFSIFFTQSKVVYTEWLTCAQFLKKNVRFGYVVQDIVLQICNIKPFLKITSLIRAIWGFREQSCWPNKTMTAPLNQFLLKMDQKWQTIIKAYVFCATYLDLTIFSKKSAHVKKSGGLSIFLLLLVGLENVAPPPKAGCWPYFAESDEVCLRCQCHSTTTTTGHFGYSIQNRPFSNNHGSPDKKEGQRRPALHTHICLQLLCIHTVYIHSEAEGNNCSLLVRLFKMM